MIYFIQAGEGPVKIGVAKNVEQRLAALQTAHYEPLRVLKTINGGLKAERQIHSRLSSFRLAGEWFKWTAEVQAIILELETAILQPDDAYAIRTTPVTLPDGLRARLDAERSLNRRGVEAEILVLLDEALKARERRK